MKNNTFAATYSTNYLNLCHFLGMENANILYGNFTLLKKNIFLGKQCWLHIPCSQLKETASRDYYGLSVVRFQTEI